LLPLSEWPILLPAVFLRICLNLLSSGISSVPLHENYPKRIRTRLQEAFKLIDKKLLVTDNEAIIVGVESRTSSPIGFLGEDTLEHVKWWTVSCGEAPGYAGGIVSSAMDGERCAEAFAENYLRR